LGSQKTAPAKRCDWLNSLQRCASKICRSVLISVHIGTIRSKLKTAKISIPPVWHDKLGMSSLFHNPTFIEPNNAVGEAHRGLPMRDRQDSALFRSALKRI
jgi:hypothetical protein